MKAKILRILWFSICLLLLLQKGETSNFRWTSVEPYARKLCRIEEDCNETVTNFGEPPNRERNACCKGCFCENDCYEHERVQRVYDGLTQCVNTIDDNRAAVVYRFIVKEPKDGCTTPVTAMTGPEASCENDTKAAPWGNFYPVYSLDKMVNFKNERCALCHGATNTIKWNVYAFFWGKNSQRLGEFRKFYKDFNSSDMMMAFYPPNVNSREYEHVCPFMKDKCATNSDSFYIPASVDLSHAQVVQACEEGIVSPYIYSRDDVFKNVFCAICSNRVGKLSDSLICDEDLLNADDNMKGSGQSFASLIDQNFIKSKMDEDEKMREKNVKVACLAFMANDTLVNDPFSKVKDHCPEIKDPCHEVKNPCREVLCPAFQVRQQDGTCRFPMNKIFTTRLTVHINLTTSGIVDSNQLRNMSKEELETIFKKGMPWPRHWELIEVFRRKDMSHRNSSEFYISVGYKNFDFVDIRYLKGFISVALLRNWKIELGKPYVFRQQFHKHGLFKKTMQTADNVVLLKPKWAVNSGINDLLSNLSSPTWEVVLVNTRAFYYKPPGVPLEITNLYFCDQIEMNELDFVGSTNEFPLLLKYTGEVLYPWQYYLYKGENGSLTANVCIEDSGFELVKQNNRGSFLVSLWGVAVKNLLLIVLTCNFESHFFQMYFT